MRKGEEERLKRIEKLAREALRTYLFRECDGCEDAPLCLVCELAGLLKEPE